MLPLYAFSDSQSATITQSEVFGRPTLLAEINGLLLDQITDVGAADCEESHATSALHRRSALNKLPNLKYVTVKSGTAPPIFTSPYPVPELEVKTSLLRALYSGDPPENRVLIQVVATEPADNKRKSVKSNDGKSPEGDQVGGYLDATNHLPITAPYVGLKQVVDCRLPKKASYQAIVFEYMKVKSLQLSMQSSSNVEVRIDRYESIPMVSTMGLLVSESKAGKYTTVDTIKADFAIWAHVRLEAQDGINFTTRAGTYEAPVSQKDLVANANSLKAAGQAIIDSLFKVTGLAPPPKKQPAKSKPQSKTSSRGKKKPRHGRQPIEVSQGKTTP